ENISVSRSAYIAMEISAWYIIVPFCLASLVTGVLQAVGTKWGLLKYYWVVVKLFLTTAITIFLLLHMKVISYLGGVATENTVLMGQAVKFRIQLIADAAIAILVLLAITTISVYKPWGLIKYKTAYSDNNVLAQAIGKPITSSAKTYIVIGVIVSFLIVILLHLFGGGMKMH
ncbi:MAG: hypothetical protein ABI921_13430, partial [Panacibacter sp.]